MRTDTPSGPPHFVPLIVLAALVLLSLGVALRGDFVWDDAPLIVDNRQLRSPDAFNEIVTTSFWETGDRHDRFRSFFRPVVSLSYFVDFRLWGQNPFGFHLTNLLLHFLCCWLVHRLLLLERVGGWPALAGAALFAVHPVHVESVAWISGRTDLLCGLFFLGAFVLHRRAYAAGGGLMTRAAAPLLFALALFAKEMAATLPVMIVADRWFDSSGVRPGARLRRAAAAVWPYLLVLLLYGLARSSVLGGGGPPLFTLDPVAHLATALFVLARYMLLLLMPWGLDAHYPYTALASLASPLMLVSAVILAVIAAAAMRFGRIDRRIPFWILWTFVGLAPVMAFGRFGDILLADRFLYLPSVALAAVLAISVRGSRSFPVAWRRALLAALALVLILFSGASLRRTRIWSDDMTLFSTMLRTSPDSALVRSNLGLARYHREEFRTAIEEFHVALELAPDFALARNNLAAALEREGLLAEALIEYRRALDDAPLLAEAATNAAVLEMRLGRAQQGLGQLRDLVRAHPDYVPGHYALAHVLDELGRPDEALVEVGWVLERDPFYAQAHYLLGKIRHGQGRLDEAAAAMRRFLELWPEATEHTAAARRIIEEAAKSGEPPGGTGT